MGPYCQIGQIALKLHEPRFKNLIPVCHSTLTRVKPLQKIAPNPLGSKEKKYIVAESANFSLQDGYMALSLAHT